MLWTGRKCRLLFYAAPRFPSPNHLYDGMYFYSDQVLRFSFYTCHWTGSRHEDPHPRCPWLLHCIRLGSKASKKPPLYSTVVLVEQCTKISSADRCWQNGLNVAKVDEENGVWRCLVWHNRRRSVGITVPGRSVWSTLLTTWMSTVKASTLEHSCKPWTCSLPGGRCSMPYSCRHWWKTSCISMLHL
jgi:hypothetical protein